MTQHTPINYKNEYHRLLEEKEKNEAFYRDKLCDRGRFIVFLSVMLFVASITLLIRGFYGIFF